MSKFDREYVGKYFLVCRHTGLNSRHDYNKQFDELYNYMKSLCDGKYEYLNYKTAFGDMYDECNGTAVSFIKIIGGPNHPNGLELDPFFYHSDWENSISVSSFNIDELYEANYYIDDNIQVPDEESLYMIPNFLYCYLDSLDCFNEINDVHFCSVIYDQNNQKLIAAVTEPDSEYTNLYFGYRKANGNLMYSNSKDIILHYCNRVYKMNNYTVMVNGKQVDIFNSNYNKITRIDKEAYNKKMKQFSECRKIMEKNFCRK